MSSIDARPDRRARARSARLLASLRQHVAVLRRCALPAAGSLLLLGAAAAPRTAAAQQADLVLNLGDSPDPVPATGVITYSATGCST